MSVLALMENDLRLVRRGGGLVVERRGASVSSVQTHHLREVHLYGAADVSAAARNALLREGIDVVYLTLDGRYRGRLVAAEGKNGALRLAQYGLVADRVRRLTLAKQLVEGKIANQQELLQRRQRRLRDERIADAMVALRDLRARSADAADLDVLRGFEGMAARWFFEAFGKALRHPELTFEGRNRRPPRDPVNACLSYGYTLLVVRVEQAVRAVGLDVYLGALHEAGRGAPALALDLAEEARPVVDDLVLTLLNRRQLSADDFRRPPEEEVGPDMEDAVYLGKVGRTILMRAWEQRLREREAHPITGERWPLLALFQEQARQVARVCQGEADVYRPVRFGARS